MVGRERCSQPNQPLMSKLAQTLDNSTVPAFISRFLSKRKSVRRFMPLVRGHVSAAGHCLLPGKRGWRCPPTGPVHPFLFFHHQRRYAGIIGVTNVTGYSTDKEPKSPPPIEQRGEYRVTTRQGSQPAPPAATTALKGVTKRQGIEEACEARRQQSRSWSTRDVGPQSQANHDSKRK
jgi:hypothetical protein